MKSVIIADNSLIMRTVIKKAFEKMHYDVREAKKGAELLSLYEKDPPTLVTLDLDMPTMSGIETLRNLKIRYPEAVVFICSSDGMREHVLECAK